VIKNIIKNLLFITFIVTVGFSFFGQTVKVNAGTPTPTPTTTTPANSTATSTGNNPDNKGFGVLKECQVDGAEQIDPTKATERVNGCIKQIIQLVIVISILLAVISITVYGIQTMNPLATNAGGINAKIAERIKGIAVGGVLLGMFGTILGTINPATLNTSSIFGGKVIESFREYISNGAKTTQTQADTGRNTASTPDANLINSIIKDGKLDKTIVQTKKKELITLVTKNDECTNVFSDSATGCKGFTPFNPKTIELLKAEGIKSTSTNNSEFKSSNVNANFDIESISEGGGQSTYSIKFVDKKYPNKIIKATGPDCKPKSGKISKGEKAFDGTCVITTK
jgi:hypothetical protein